MATKTNEKKEKKEKKFNTDRVTRLVKNSLKAAFPKDNFIVSSFVNRVEVLYFDNTICSAKDIEMFNTLFCILVGNVKKEQLVFAKIRKEIDTPQPPAPAAK